MTVDKPADPRGDDDIPEFLRANTPLASVSTVQVPATARPSDVPGEPGLWFFIMGELTLFGVFFVAFLLAERKAPDLFARSALELDAWSGMTNTVLLLTSSFCVVAALRAQRETPPVSRRSIGMLAAAVSIGIAFVAVKVFEYSHLLSHGHGPTENLFFTYYFTLTGIHLMHVLVGIGILCAVISTLRHETSTPAFIEGGGAYWHMVDALWMVLFPVVYLVSIR